MPGMAAVGDRAPPVPRRERDARAGVLAAGGRRQRDVVAPHGVVGAGVLQRGQHRVVAGGRHQLQLAGQLEHHRPVLAEEPVHQHLVVVAVVGRHLLDVGQLRGEPADLLHRGHRAGRLLPRLLGGGLAVRVKVLQHGAVGADQPLRHRPLPQPDLLQLGPGLLEDGRHPLAQHLGQVVAGPHPRRVDQARHQRQLLGLPVPRQRVDVLGSRLPGEVGDLRPARPPPATPAVSPSSSTSSRYSACALNRDQVARWAGFFSRLNIDLPSGPAVFSSPSARCRPSGPIRATMPAKISRVDLGADRGGHLVQRGERRELQRGLDQPLQRHVDQVRRVVLHQRRLADRGLRHRPGPPLVIGHALAVPHLLAVQLGRPRRPVVRLGLRGQPQAVPHVVRDGLGNLLPRAEPRHLLEALQVRHQRQQRLRALGPLPRPGDLILSRGEEHVQHPRRGQPPELRIGSALDRRHPLAPCNHAEPGRKHSNGERPAITPQFIESQPASPGL